MDYQVVYDVTQESWPWHGPAIGLASVAFGMALWRTRDRWPWMWHGRFRSSAGWRKASAAIWLAFSILWTAMVTAGTLGPYLRARRALRDGTASVVEGRVENFHPMPYSGHDTERFTVGNVHFAFTDYSMGTGFNRTSSHGGPVREGLRVRIHFIGSREPMIAKLEIAQ